MDGKANHGWIGVPLERARHAAARVAPWGLSFLFHLGVAAVAALVAVAVLPTRSRALTASGEVLAAPPAERVVAAASAVGGGGPVEVPHHAARSAEHLAAAPPAPRHTVLAGLDSAAGATGLFAATFRPPPRSSLLGAGGNARHVVYVIDRSGSMLGVFDDVRRAVLQSIARLDDTQDFHIILFAQGRVIENAPARLVPSTNANKVQAAEFLASARAGYQSDPVPALTRAFDVLDGASSGGKLIYLITDGAFPDASAVTAVIRARNKHKDVRINTYCCGDDGSGAATLAAIARATGGLSRQVTSADGGP